MQGGHPDGIRFPISLFKHEEAESSGNESEISIDEPVRLGHRLDTIVLLGRETFGAILAYPVAWIQLQPSVEALRAHKNRRIVNGIEFILWIQTFRNKYLDFLFQCFSFGAEEEFYLLVLPGLFWNGQYDLARKLTFVVVTGLFAGNIIKDVFELPRPSSPPVWRPGNQAAIDSTHLQDFGFPSTHSMNSLTNSLLIVWYFWSGGTSYDLIRIVAAILWIVCLSFGRMYLGAHTGTDVRGGLGLGVIVFSIYVKTHESLESCIQAQTFWTLLMEVILLIVVSLLLCPQPRPPTPTFHQNALLMGLFGGLLLGGYLADSYSLSNSFPEPSGTINPTFDILLRNIFGFTIMITIRLLVKSMVTLVLETFLGIKTKPRSEVVQRRSKAKRGKRRVIRLFTRDIDIIAVAVVKTLTYLAAAFTITFVTPYLWTQFQQSYSLKSKLISQDLN